MEWLNQFGGFPGERILSETLERLRAAGVSELDKSEEGAESNESDSESSTSKKSEESRLVPPTPAERPEGETWQIT